MTEPEYDERTCITAGELRAVGCKLPEDIPDVAWVPRSAMLFDVGKAVMGDEPGKVSIPMGVTFTQPFRWMVVEATIETNR